VRCCEYLLFGGVIRLEYHRFACWWQQRVCYGPMMRDDVRHTASWRTYSRILLYTYHSSAPRAPSPSTVSRVHCLGLTVRSVRRRGCRAGRHVHRRPTPLLRHVNNGAYIVTGYSSLHRCRHLSPSCIATVADRPSPPTSLRSSATQRVSVRDEPAVSSLPSPSSSDLSAATPAALSSTTDVAAAAVVESPSPSLLGSPRTTDVSPSWSPLHQSSGTSWCPSSPSVDDQPDIESSLHLPPSVCSFLSMSSPAQRPRRHLSTFSPAGRHALCADTTRVTFGSLNVCSLNNKVDAIRQLMDEYMIDVMCLTETWHENSDALPIKRLRSHGLQVLERARPIPESHVGTTSGNFVNHGVDE